MRRKHFLRAVLVCALALLLSLSCTACGSSLAENTRLYFTNTSAVLSTLLSSGQSSSGKAAQDSSETNAGEKLAAPTEFNVDADGNYSFTGVEGADYYLLYFCTPDAVNDEDTFVYSSQPIQANESNQYSGQCANEFLYAFGEYLVKVFAFPELTDSTHQISSAATASYSYSGNQSAPEIYYYWNTFDGTMGVQVANLNTYLYEAYPDQVDVTFTNTSDPGDTVTLTIEGVSPQNSGAVSDQLTRGATYQVTAVATSTNSFVLNGTSDTTVVSEAMTLGDNHLFTLGYSYTDGFANNIFNWPVLCESFDLANGGSAGQTAGGFGGVTDFMTAPAETASGSAYSYSLQAGNWAGGTLDLYADGTFHAEETGGGPVNASTIEGTWADNGDGTATLNYDHNTIVIN